MTRDEDPSAKTYIHPRDTEIRFLELRDCARKKDPYRYTEITEAYQHTDMTKAEYVRRLRDILDDE